MLFQPPSILPSPMWRCQLTVCVIFRHWLSIAHPRPAEARSAFVSGLPASSESQLMALVCLIAISGRTSAYVYICLHPDSLPFVVSDLWLQLVFNNHVGEALPFDHTSGLASSSSQRRRLRKPLAASGDAGRCQASLDRQLSRQRWGDPCWGSPGLLAIDDIPLLAWSDCEITSLWSLYCHLLVLVLTVRFCAPLVAPVLPLAQQRVQPRQDPTCHCRLDSTAWPPAYYCCFISQLQTLPLILKDKY